MVPVLVGKSFRVHFLLKVASLPTNDLEVRPPASSTSSASASSSSSSLPPQPSTLQSHSQLSTTTAQQQHPEVVEAGEVGNSLEVHLSSPFEQYGANLTPPDGFREEDRWVIDSQIH